MLHYAVLLTKEILVGSPPHSSNTTNRLPLGFSQERGTWYLIFPALVMLLARKSCNSFKQAQNCSLPSLRGLVAISLAFFLRECACIVTVPTATFCYVCRPVSAYALPIYPYLAFAHAHHVQTQWILPSWSLKCSLQTMKTDCHITYQVD